MPLFIHDDDVDRLAVELQRLTKTKTKAATVRRALLNELERARQSLPLKDRLATVRKKARSISAALDGSS